VSNTMAIVLASLILAALLGDYLLTGSETTMFLLRKIFLLVEHLNFWR
jgi:hypothetical protein